MKLTQPIWFSMYLFLLLLNSYLYYFNSSTLKEVIIWCFICTALYISGIFAIKQRVKEDIKRNEAHKHFMYLYEKYCIKSQEK